MSKPHYYSVFMSTVNATDDEKKYIQRYTYISLFINKLVHYRSQYPIILGHQNTSPSLVLDDFLFLGNFQHALDVELLEQLKIGHILNVCDFKLSEKIYEKFKVIEIPLMDATYVNIKQHFDRTNALLHDIFLKKERCLVHCAAGVSRSATIVLAYLMKYHHETLELAFHSLMDKRPQIFPNEGFLLQLIRYERELIKSKEINQNEENLNISDGKENIQDIISDDQTNKNPIETVEEFTEKHDIHTSTFNNKI
ncbi:unnamed protein product [Didymodactylos carnosus]|uniref:protein-tyrosine-phosphatase n=1 Tax=Didymodactylos carnosus TaxID=1234261 RepID=A0A814M6H8_9BILA|nr:unnamed protein product [Didymodactylos carnosus]CAF1072458.1 unnamed protein product [Didymodactylos carnosus]CAF3600024.1 unnamed protein product [Didymodactylos carnosus]CAF3839372.1 unnamed protein product [Didymodactylos carnosus]